MYQNQPHQQKQQSQQQSQSHQPHSQQQPQSQQVHSQQQSQLHSQNYSQHHSQQTVRATNLNVPQYIPFMDVLESNQDIRYLFALPGLRPEQVEVSIADNYLQIQAHMPPKSDDPCYLHKEILEGNFTREAMIPPYINSCNPNINLQDGILSVVFTKSTDQSNP